MLDGRWRLVEMVGHGASGFTWKAEHVADGRIVAIKELSFRRLTDLKAYDLFQREVGTLRRLDHPAIPRYESDFVVEDERFVSLYLVQEFIRGAALTPEGPWDEAAVVRLLQKVVEVLVYLRRQRPEVVHRDIKPANIMRREDGSYALIDFGSARAAASATLGGSTIAGTLGYMAPEQLQGLATPASDVYGLAATAIALLAGRDASDVIDPHKPDAWPKKVRVSPPLRALLEDMLHVDPECRLTELSVIRDRLRSLKPKKPGRGAKRRAAGLPAPEVRQRPPAPTSLDPTGLDAVRSLLKPADTTSWRDRVVGFGRDPVGKLGWLFAFFVIGFMAFWALSLVMAAADLGPPPFHLLVAVPIIAVALYLALVIAGLWLGRRDRAVFGVLRFRSARRFLRRTYRSDHWTRLVLAIPLAAPLIVGAGAIAEALGHPFATGLAAGAGLILADQLYAALRGRNGWRRALHAEFGATWPRGTEQRKLFARLATALWCGTPGFHAKSTAGRWFEDRYKAMKRLATTPLTSAQREHVELVLLSCHAGFGADEPLQRSLDALDQMAPRKATREALLAAVDEATSPERAEMLAQRYLAEIARSPDR